MSALDMKQSSSTHQHTTKSRKSNDELKIIMKIASNIADDSQDLHQIIKTNVTKRSGKKLTNKLSKPNKSENEFVESTLSDYEEEAWLELSSDNSSLELCRCHMPTSENTSTAEISTQTSYIRKCCHSRNSSKKVIDENNNSAIRSNNSIRLRNPKAKSIRNFRF